MKLVNSGKMNIFGEPTLEINLKRVETERDASPLVTNVLRGSFSKPPPVETVSDQESFIPSISAASCFEVDPDDAAQ